MSENTGVTWEQQRFSSIRRAVEKAKQLGITDPGRRAELVIDARSISSNLKKPWLKPRQIRRFPSVGKLQMNEDQRVKEGAIHKYFSIKHFSGPSRSRVIVESLHSEKPVNGQINAVLGRQGLDQSRRKEIEGKSEVGVKEIALETAELSSSDCITAKKPRIWTNANRGPYIRTVKGTSSSDSGKIQAAEFSRRVRAALFWSYEKILKRSGVLTRESLKEKVLCLSLHGKVDGDNSGFVIAGGVESADRQIVEWFRNELELELNSVGISDSVVIDDNGKYMGLESLTSYRKEPEDVKRRHVPAFGNNFNKIQLEISKKYRSDPSQMNKVSTALAKVLLKFNEVF